MFNYFKKRKKNEMVKTDQIINPIIKEEEVLWDDVRRQEKEISNIITSAIEQNLDWIFKYQGRVVHLEEVQSLLDKICPICTKSDEIYKKRWVAVPKYLKDTTYRLYIEHASSMGKFYLLIIHLSIKDVYCSLTIEIENTIDGLKLAHFSYSNEEKWFLIVNILNNTTIVNYIKKEFGHDYQMEIIELKDELTKNLRQSYNENQLILSKLNKSK